MYENSSTVVKGRGEIGIVWHKCWCIAGISISYLLFAVVLDEINKDVKSGFLKEILYTATWRFLETAGRKWEKVFEKEKTY